MNLPALVRDLAHDAGIPSALIPAVEHRAQMALRVVTQWKAFVHIHTGARHFDVVAMVDRVVERSVADYQAGRLERRVTEPPVLRMYGAEV